MAVLFSLRDPLCRGASESCTCAQTAAEEAAVSEQCALPLLKGDTCSLGWPCSLQSSASTLLSSFGDWHPRGFAPPQELSRNKVPLILQGFEHRTDEAALGSAPCSSPHGVTVGMS